jgi:uncharacterized protein YbjT (DUF2867 family)
VKQALSGCTGVHISLQAGWHPADIERVEHLGTLRVIELAAQQPLARLTYVSGMFVGAEVGEEYEDKEAQEQLIQQSTLDWTIVRPSRLTNGPRRGRYRMQSSLEFSLRSSISRADVADGKLRQLTDSTFRQKCLELSY